MLPTPATVAALLLFVSGTSGYPLPEGVSPPAIHLADSVGGRRIGQDKPEAAVTDMRTGEIYLYAGWSGDAADNCLLAHELTHWLQRFQRMPWACSSLEPAAYRITLACYRHYRQPAQLVAWARRMVDRPHCAGPQR